MEILKYPHPDLAEVARPVTKFGSGLKGKVRALWDILKKEDTGVGLAGPQVGMPYRIFVVHAEGLKQAFINPSFEPLDDHWVSYSEGCLSVPDRTIEVPRRSRIRVEFQDEKGTRFKDELSGFPAIVFQHEYDHLEGRTIEFHAIHEEKPRCPKDPGHGIIPVRIQGTFLHYWTCLNCHEKVARAPDRDPYELFTIG